ncbi:MAG: 2-amino-4-hydroxy-6-hydroxymethyldihydropteridine diphosphokinase [Gammaproteobacteria bacterium]|nr:2-amino-4-hydroxy-6-hydroxymethyldihydropteridine diphosphokinase [Gammaproteobacteria bacterium]
MARIYISIGSNTQREHYLRAGVRALAEHFLSLTISPVYESSAVGFDGDNFYNLVVAVDSDLSPQAVDKLLKQIEDNNQRDRSGPRFSGRTLDLDLLLYDDLILNEGKLILPREEITQNAFVLKPLVDIAPTLCDPRNGKSYRQLWDEYDQAKQPLWVVEFSWLAD